MASSATYNGISTFGANLERGRGFFESYGRGMLAYAATAVGGPIGGGAASAALVGGDPGRGAALGAVQGAFAVAGAFIPVPADPLLQAGRAAASGAAQGAAGAAIVGGDAGQGAWRGAASAAAASIAASIANGDFQATSDAGQGSGGAAGKAAAEAQASQAGTAGATLRPGLLRRWVGEGPLTVDKGKWALQGTWPPQKMISAMPMPGARVVGVFQREITYTQHGHFEYFDGAIRGGSFTRTWGTSEQHFVSATLIPRSGSLTAFFQVPSDE